MNITDVVLGNSSQVELSVNQEIVKEVEVKLNVRVPDTLAKLWLNCDSISFGEGNEVYVSPLIDLDFYLETISDLIENFANMLDEEGVKVAPEQVAMGIKPYHYHNKWIPLFCVDGLYHFVDLDPLEHSCEGQIISLDSMGGEHAHKEFNNLTELFDVINKEVQRGNCEAVVEGKNLIVNELGDLDLHGKLMPSQAL